TSPFFHLPHRIQYLIHHYDKQICPVLVTKDGTDNPYRRHILTLALRNACLQNAVAALSANNIRMRLQSCNSLLYTAHSPSQLTNPAALAEERLYRQTSINQLNKHLSRPDTAQDDSVLATLPILCLFHVSQSGFCHFQSQLLGVQTLLRLRRVSMKRSTETSAWVQLFFTWLDVMTSALNDREVQLHSNFSSNDVGTLELFSGCDRTLFALIERLGTANLLAQGRAVKRSLGAWTGNEVGYPDARTEFWGEWEDIVTKLNGWEGASGDRDIWHLNELYRYGALLYLTRLANPGLSSADEKFQGLVGRAMRHVTALGLGSCVNKFLLWPLFMVGTECTDGGQRSEIRRRCVGIQMESGFYNNLSGLGVLERVWRGQSESGSSNKAHQSRIEKKNLPKGRRNVGY
ncbi:hypothetical protein K470DRAFT_201597, partial [Piedraia hortae CBS 480.64]